MSDRPLDPAALPLPAVAPTSPWAAEPWASWIVALASPSFASRGRNVGHARAGWEWAIPPELAVADVPIAEPGDPAVRRREVSS